ncbi:hypothetical protein BS47DRAFT_1330128 [Hydnum rufescens UP504]|uniref:Peregrin n=1 Tax=Hydnum rufescens UP504 TaxID=1448309 RepID=A0A9P6DVG1_9AGAM|nr:hypothetical protein BS47DRAFT_1330128 [Hydnum rufescens UP504]
MARRASSLTISQVPQLPKVSFRKVDSDVPTRPIGINDAQARSFGYNDTDYFTMPDHYIRHIEPIEAELAHQVEYDMDEQDQEWLDVINAERRKEQMDQVSYETFEIIMDRLEKEWFDLMKRVPKQDTALPSEDSTCAICDDGEGENSNAIVFCDGCNLAVHQDCYGVPYIPEGQWLCRKCTVAPETPVSCILCPNEGGAFKQTTEAKWAHLLCAIWVPEITVGNQVFMEPIDNVRKIPKNRWKLACSLCPNRMGACIQCDNRSCFTAFHVTCARKHNMLMPMKTLPDPDHHDVPAPEPPLRAFCEKHLPHDMKTSAVTQPPEDPETTTPPPTPKSNKSARAYAKTYRLGPPLVPAIVVSRLVDYISRISMRKKPVFLLAVCKYWSLKREARRGAPLLKRLHLEPWTASSISKQQTDEAKQSRLQYLIRIRSDVEKVRMLAELARKREKEKTRQSHIIFSIVDNTLFPHDAPLRSAFEQVSSLDRSHLFEHPVSRAQAPDYDTIVKNPMNWSRIKEKLDLHAYGTVEEFKTDILLVLDNSTLYNKPEHGYHKLAARIKVSSAPILAKLDIISRSQISSASQPADTPSIGDLEQSLEILRILCSPTSLKDSTDLIIEPDPLASLFLQELERRKETPPMPSKALKSTGVGVPKIRIRDRRLRVVHVVHSSQALEMAPEVRGSRMTRSPGTTTEPTGADTEGDDRLDPSSPGQPDHGPAPVFPPSVSPKTVRVAPARTRSARALAAAFEAEANAPPPEVKAAAEREAAEEAATLERAAAAAAAAAADAKAQKRHTLQGKKRSRDVEVEEPEENYRPSPPSGMPQLVEEVDNKQSFKMFNQGWVLPDGSKRNRPSASKRVNASPPRREREPKKPRLSTTASIPQDISTVHNHNVATDHDMVLDSTPGSGPSMELVPSGPVTEQPLGLTIPEGSGEELGGLPPSPPKQIESRTQTEQPIDPDSSDLSELSDLDDDRGENPSSSKPTDASSEREITPAVPVEIGKFLPGGTLVWAKAPSFPFWPAVVFEIDDGRVPLDVQSLYKQTQKNEKNAGEIVYIVQFYDNKQSWGVMKPKQMKLLGEEPEIDQALLSAKFKSPTLKRECHNAYKKALAELDVDAKEAFLGSGNLQS